MTIRLGAALVLLISAAPVQDTPAAVTIKAEAVGLHVNKAPYDNDKDFAHPTEPAPGTRVAVLVTVEAGGIIRLEDRKSSLAKFTDDKGLNLLAAKPDKESFHTPIGSFPRISGDRKALLVDLQAATVPTAGAKSLQVEATLVLTIGKDPEALKQEKVEAAKGVKFTVGTATFTITDAGKNDFGGDPMKIGLESKEGVKIAKIRFFTPDGHEIESRLGSHGSMAAMGGDATFTWEYTLKKLVPSVTVEVTAWKTVATVEVPVRLEVSAGF